MTEERSILRDQARRFVEATYRIAELRERRRKVEPRAKALGSCRALGELGWIGMTLDEHHGGSGMGFADLGIVLEELGRRLAPVPLVSATVASHALESFADEALCKRVLPAITSGEAIVAVAFDETPRFDPYRIDTRAERHPDGGYRLHGRKLLVREAPAADWILVTARTAGHTSDREGITAFLVERGRAGVSREDAVLLDSTSAATLTFDGTRVGDDETVGEVGGAAGLLERAIAVGAICLSAEMLGTADEAFQRTLRHLKEREQFGVAIGSFQALQHRAARWYGEIELLRSLVTKGLGALDDATADVPKLASACKARACDTVMLSAEESIQMHGGIGMTDEHEIGFFLKRARVAQQWLGDATYHRDRYAALSGY